MKYNYILTPIYIMLFFNSCCAMTVNTFEIINKKNSDIFIMYKEQPKSTIMSTRSLKPKESFSLTRELNPYGVFLKTFNYPVDVYVSDNYDMSLHFVVEDNHWVKNKLKINHYNFNFENYSKSDLNVFIKFVNANLEQDFRSVKINSKFALPKCSFQNGNKLFAKWFEYPLWTKSFYDEATINVNENNIELHSVWIDKGHTVVFYSNSNENRRYSQNIEENVNFKLRLNEFENDGYKFLGWSKDKDAIVSQYNDEATLFLGKDLVLYAVWQKL